MIAGKIVSLTATALAVIAVGAFSPIIYAQSATDQEKLADPWKAGREASAVKAPKEYIELEKIRNIPDSPDKRLFKSVWRVGAFGDGTPAVLDIAAAEVVLLNLEGEEQARWGGRGSEDGKFMGCQSMEVSPEDTVYIQDGFLRQIMIFDRTGRLVESFKDIEGMMQFRFSASGDIYTVPIGLVREDDANAFVRVFDGLGTLEREFGTIDSVEFPEIKWSQFCPPLAGNKETILLSRQFPMFQVYSTTGVLQDEVRIDDPRFKDRAKVNRGEFYDSRGENRIYGALLFNEVQWLADDLLIQVVLDEPGVEFLRVNTLGEKICSYFFKPRSPKEEYMIRDFVVIDSPKGLFFVGISSKPWPQVVVFSPVEELPAPKEEVAQ
jgi:hypothetical protein